MNLNTFENVPFTTGLIVESSRQVKELAEEMEELITLTVSSPRHKALALTRLEELVMWVNKGLREDQITINKITEEDEENKNL